MGEPQPQIYEFGDFCLDASRRLLTARDGRVVLLTPKPFETLLYLVRHGGAVLGKDELMRAVWPDTAVEENNLSQSISQLRRALGEKPGQHRYIATVQGRGFRFVAPVTTRADEDDREGSDGPTSGPGAGRSEAVETVSTRAARPAGGLRMNLRLVALASVLAVGVAGLIIWRARTVTAPLTSPAPPDAPSTIPAASPAKAIAVLPFKPLVPEGREEALEVGMADTLIAKLSNIGGLSVRPLGAVRRYGGLEQDPLSAGRQLGVEAVLDGTIQRSGDRVGVTARLLSVGDGRQLWEGRFEAPFTDIFSVQDAISAQVAGSLRPRLTDAEERRLAKHYTENVEAYQLYLRGRYHLLRNTRSEIQTGASYFRQAIEIDPSYALAYAGLANAYHALAGPGEMPPTELLPQAKAAAQKAVEIDDGLAEAHALLGFVIFWYDWDWDAAENQFRRALELDPNSADAHYAYADLLSYTGRHAEALAEIKRARELDPLNLRINTIEGAMLINAGRADEALARLRKTLELEPNYWYARQYVANAYMPKGMFAEAVAEARRAKEFSESATRPRAFLGYALAKAGRRAEARAELEGLLRLSRERHVSPYNIAMIYNGLGESDEALGWLERGYREREPRMVFLKVEPKWNNLRDDPRFQDLVRRVGLPQ
jgi:DNA-binding winged helix-turn-helix (wHTH) protein/TolB-like protein/Tfp pilus assembly protein PilF